MAAVAATVAALLWARLLLRKTDGCTAVWMGPGAAWGPSIYVQLCCAGAFRHWAAVGLRLAAHMPFWLEAQPGQVQCFDCIITDPFLLC